MTSGRLVLSRARWRIRREQLDDVPRVRAQMGMPRWVCLAEHDRELPLDLEHPLAIDALVAHARLVRYDFLARLYRGRIARGERTRW